MWGVAGCGWIARDHAAPVMGEVVALLDPDPEARAATAAAAASPRAVSTDDVDVFLAAPGLQAVYVATPNALHRELAEAAAAAGKHVLCEKPMATTLEDARAMAGACAQAGVLYATGHNQRFHPAHQRLRELVAGGALGTITQARIHYACTAPAWWGRDDWHWDPDVAGGGALFDLAPHGLDLLGTVLDQPLEEVHALRQHAVRDEDVEDGAVLMARYGHDVLAVLQVSYACPETYPRRRLELVGTRAMAIATDTMGQTPGGGVALVDAATGDATDVAFDVLADPFALQIAAFEAAVRGDAPWPFTVEQDLAAMAALASVAA